MAKSVIRELSDLKLVKDKEPDDASYSATRKTWTPVRTGEAVPECVWAAPGRPWVCVELNEDIRHGTACRPHGLEQMA